MKNNKILFISPIKSRSGYGEHARELAEVLLEFDVDFFCTSWGSNPESTHISKNTEINSRIVGEIKKDLYDVCIHLGMPNEFKKIARYNIGITAGVETDICPITFIEGYNRMDLIIVPSQFTKSTILNTNYVLESGDTYKCVTDIEVIPEYSKQEFSDLDIKPSTDIKEILDDINEQFCFLFVGQWVSSNTDDGGRKNVSSLINTFCSAFPTNENVALILKTNGPDFSSLDKNDIVSRISNECENHKNPPPIYLIHGDLTLHEMSALYNNEKIKCHISHTRGEGFGRPLLESTFTGKPVIAPKWGGQLDFLNKKQSLLIPGQLKKVGAVNQYFCENAKWFEVDESRSKEFMVDLYKNYDKYKNKSMQLREKNLKLFSKDEINLQYKTLLNERLPIKAETIEFNLPDLE